MNLDYYLTDVVLFHLPILFFYQDNRMDSSSFLCSFVSTLHYIVYEKEDENTNLDMDSCRMFPDGPSESGKRIVMASACS